MIQANVQIKIFNAAVDPNVDRYLESEVEKWRLGTPKLRTIINLYPALSAKEIILMVTYVEQDQVSFSIKERVNFLILNGKKIFGRNLEYDDYIEMGFPVDLL